MNTDVQERLKLERTRLGLYSKEVAEICGVSPHTVGRWESGTAIPSNKLEKLANQGFDVQYILTGVRSTMASGVAEPAATYRTHREDEVLLVRWFRALPNQEERRKALELVKALGVANGVSPTEFSDTPIGPSYHNEQEAGAVLIQGNDNTVGSFRINTNGGKKSKKRGSKK